MAEGPSARLWERRLGDDDALRVRVGIGVVDLDIGLEGQGAKRDGISVDIGIGPCPIAVDLSAGVVGIAGPREVTAALARAMIAHLVTARSPRDLRLVVLCQDDAHEWAWTRWLPHSEGARAWAGLGNTTSSRSARLRELVATIEDRERSSDGPLRSRKKRRWDHDVVVVADQSRLFRTLPGWATVLERGPEVGVFVLALDTDRARLPQECVSDIVVEKGSTTRGTVTTGDDTIEHVLFDGFQPRLAERLARALAPLVHVAGVGDDNLLPDQVRLVDVLGVDLEAPDPGWLMARWAAAPRCTTVAVGAGQGAPFYLDLVVDGPHALVAGTTGAGKSELLQSLIVSLALANRPDALNFVLVDYKGGSAFADCARLPHVVGMVTNLDGRGTERALESLDAELRRREEVLAGLGAKDADAAWDRDPVVAAERGLARLVLVIDEFAELKSELPGFIDGLVRIARVGRSLGVHLILATQRPSGAITPEMQSNTNLRIALRMVDKSDSTDVLGSGEAAQISTATPGRGYARRGAGALPEVFQTARVAGHRPGAAHATRHTVQLVPRSWAEVGEPVVYPPVAEAPIDHDDTDLRALVDLIGEATKQLDITRSASPWLDPLPHEVTVNEIPEAGDGQIVLGLEDIPSRQTQEPLVWDPRTDSHLVLIGGARSGRTSLLRTMAALLVTWYGPEDLHLYALDYGNGGLLPLVGSPHTGAVVTPLEQGRTARFWDRLVEEIAARQRILSRGAFGSLAEQRRGQPEAALPYVVVFIDNWDRLVADADDTSDFRESFTRLLREGPAVGVRFVITGDRSLIGDRVRAFVPTTYCLPLSNRADYTDPAVGLRADELPAVIPPGRILSGKPTREAQAGLLPGPADGESQAERLGVIVRKMAAHWARRSEVPHAREPFRLDALPDSLTLAGAARLPVADGCPDKGMVIAVGGDVQSRITYPTHSTAILVAGDDRTGKTATLLLLADQARERRLGLVFVTLRRSRLAEVGAAWGVPVFSEPEVSQQEFVTAFEGARAVSKKVGLDRAVVVIDDGEDLPGTDLGRAITDNRTLCAFYYSIHLDEMSSMIDPLFTAVRRGRRGVLLSPTVAVHGSHSFGPPVPKEYLGRTIPGRAVAFGEGSYVLGQIPLLDGPNPAAAEAGA